MSIIPNKSDCGKEKKSEVGKRWVHKEYAKGMSKAWKSKCRDLVQLSEAALRCQLTDETTCLHVEKEDVSGFKLTRGLLS